MALRLIIEDDEGTTTERRRSDDATERTTPTRRQTEHYDNWGAYESALITGSPMDGPPHWRSIADGGSRLKARTSPQSRRASEPLTGEGMHTR